MKPTSKPRPQDQSSGVSLHRDPIVWGAIRDSVPLFVPAIPFGFVLGTAMVQSELPTWIAWLSSVTIFGGAAQLALVTTAGLASWWTVVATAIVINSRHIMYSAGITPRYQNQPRWFRLLGPFFMIDQVFALAALQGELDRQQFRRYSMASGLFFFTSWLLATSAGVALGGSVPDNLGLEMAIAVMFAGLTSMSMQRFSAIVAAIVGAGVSIMLLGLPNRLGLLVGAAAGVVAAFLTDELARDGE